MKTIRKLFIFAFALTVFTISGFTQTNPVPTPATMPEQSCDQQMATGQYSLATGCYHDQWIKFWVGHNDDNTDTLTARERIAGKMASSVAKMEKPPVISEETEFHALKGAAFIKEAKTPADFVKAVKEFQAAVNGSPWFFDYHFNLAVAYRTCLQFLH